MESFYGGKQGFSFIIVKSFSSVAEMVTNFKKGPNYSAVHFDEHVIINTPNKNNLENGRLYRRGYDYTNDLGGAIYVGTIVGPAGQAPLLEMTTVANVKEKNKKEYDHKRYSEGSYAPTANLVPGKTSSGTFHDSITWACCSVKNDTDEYSTAYIGFIFPYLVTEFTATSVSPYYNRDSANENFNNINLSLRKDDGLHPYFQQWHFSIPKGIKGDTFKNFKVVTATSSIQSYPGQDDDIANNRKVLVYEYYHYDKSSNGEPVTIYLGDYNMIENITIDDEGTVTIDYEHDDDKKYEHLFKWINKVTLDENGKFKVEYNQKDGSGNPIVYETTLKWVKDIEVATDGTITLVFCNGDTKELDTKLKWIDNVELASDGTVTITYNDTTTDVFDKEIQWINSVTLDENGTFIVKYNNGTPDYKTTLKWVKNVIVSDDGTITIVYNNGDPVNYTKYLKTIRNVYIETADDSGEPGTGNQKVHIFYNTGETDVVGEPLNYILETAVTSNYHLIVYYSDPVLRQSLIDSGLDFEYKGKKGWYDLGSIKDESGILVGLNLSLEDYPTLSNMVNAIDYLNTKYPGGLTGSNFQGKVVTIGSNEENKKFYAFDYTIVNGNYKGWYYLGAFNTDISDLFMIAKEDDIDLEDKKESLSPGGMWFIVEGEENG